MRIAVIGGGIAGALLSWRLAQQASVEQLWQVPGPAAADATGASGGAVRCLELGADKRELAIASMAELVADPVLRDWSAYQVTGSIYVPPSGTDLAGPAAEIEAALPGSATVIDAEALAGQGWADPAPDSTALVEREAGYLDLKRLRSKLQADLAARRNVQLRPGESISALSGDGFELAGQRHRFDAVVLATGAWTPALLAGAGFATTDFRTKVIQYTIHQTAGWLPPCFVDEPTGLYGKPTGSGLLLGLPTEVWDAPPSGYPVDRELAARARELASARFGRLRLGTAAEPVTALDCYVGAGQLALRPVAGAGSTLFTFTGGSGGAAKTVLAASLRAATQLAGSHPDVPPTPIGRRSESS